VVEFRLGDGLLLRRPHPCGGREWLVDRLGADIGLRCGTCGHHVMIERRPLERRLAGFVTRGDEAMSRAVAPPGARQFGGGAGSVSASASRQGQRQIAQPGDEHRPIPGEPEPGGMTVLRNRPFLLLWLAQLSTQVGGNMVIFGLTIIITSAYHSSSAISALLLSFLVPAILFSAMAGVFVDRIDKRHLLIVTNILRGLAFVGIFVGGNNLLTLYLLMLFVSTVTTFFGPAEASMIPFLVPRSQLLAANGLFTLTMNVAFALGFALLGPVVAALASAQLLILIVAALYFIAAVFCWTLPPSPPVGSGKSSRRTSGSSDSIRAKVAGAVCAMRPSAPTYRRRDSIS
jgi:hypothetical protein